MSDHTRKLHKLVIELNEPTDEKDRDNWGDHNEILIMPRITIIENDDEYKREYEQFTEQELNNARTHLRGVIGRLAAKAQPWAELSAQEHGCVTDYVLRTNTPPGREPRYYPKRRGDTCTINVYDLIDDDERPNHSDWPWPAMDIEIPPTRQAAREWRARVTGWLTAIQASDAGKAAPSS